VIIIELPYPSKINSHNKGHWATKSSAIAKMRHQAKLAAIDAMNRSGKRFVGSHQISYWFSVKDNRRRDRANMIQQCKPYIDGIVDAGLIAGDHWQISFIGSVNVVIDPESYGVKIVIEEPI
jgi:hypothetical protein